MGTIYNYSQAKGLLQLHASTACHSCSVCASQVLRPWRKPGGSRVVVFPNPLGGAYYSLLLPVLASVLTQRTSLPELIGLDDGSWN